MGACAQRPVRPDAAEAAPLRFGVDVHMHLTMRRALPFFSGEPGSGALASSPNQTLVNQVDLAGLRRAGIPVVVATLWPPFALRPGRSALDEALGQLRALKAFVHRHPGFALAFDAADVRRIVGRGDVAVVPGLEGLEAVERVEDVDRLHAAGARVASLVHFTDNALADAEDDQFGTFLGRLLNGRDGGLTPLGRAVVERLFDLGIVVDLSHASERTYEDVLALAEARRVPVISSHAGPHMTLAYTVSDRSARRIAALGGVIGVGVYRSDLLVDVPEEDRLPGHQLETCDDIVSRWAHFARVAGPEAVVLGSDLSSVITRPAPGGVCPHGLRHAGDLPWLFGALSRQGLPVDQMGERWLAVMERADRARLGSLVKERRSRCPLGRRGGR